MKIYSAEQIRKADAFTIENEPIKSIDLMERAARGCFEWLMLRYQLQTSFSVFIGPGNNGGDGLAIARMLMGSGYEVNVFVLEIGSKVSPDWEINWERLKELDAEIVHINQEVDFSSLQIGTVIIDAIFGSGLSKPITGWLGECIRFLNTIPRIRITIDISSGLFSENNDENIGEIFQPHETLTFQFPKLSFMFPSTQKNVGNFHVIPIGLSEEYILKENTDYFLIEGFIVRLLHKNSGKFDYKGSYGHGGLIAGSRGKIGASVLASKAALKAGSGLITTQVPKSGVDIMQISCPEIMVSEDEDEVLISSLNDYSGFSALGAGPGLGTAQKTVEWMNGFLNVINQPLVLDADALNIISENNLHSQIPANTILTPHLGEFQRLFGKPKGDYNRLEMAKQKARELDVFIIVKGAHSAVVCPNGEVFFNSSGNPGMGTAGSGDVLTGIILGLLSQGYSAKEACVVGVYVHGLAGDIALEKQSRESLIASNIIEYLGHAFKKLKA